MFRYLRGEKAKSAGAGDSIASRDPFQMYLENEGSIKGPMRLECASLIAAVLRGLNADNLAGNSLEIGTFHGRSAIPAACFSREGEIFYVVDPFGDIGDSATLQYGGIGDEKALTENWRRVFGDTNHLRIYRKTSEAIERDEALIKEWQPLKYISVDGDHSFEGTLLDLRLAARIVMQGGVIAIDDVWNIEWPSVSQALSAFLGENNDFVPFCAGWGRLFLCGREFHGARRQSTKREFELLSPAIKNLRVLEPFPYFGVTIDVYTNRWGSASKPDLEMSGYEVGARFQALLQQNPDAAKQVKAILFG